MRDLPAPFSERMKRLLGNEFDAFIDSFSEPPVRGIRINTLKITKERFTALCPWRTEQAETLEEGLVLLDEAEHIGLHPYHAAGLFYVQEPSAMSVIAAADVAPGMRVLDLCAAPGGKSGGLAARLNGEGLLVSNEIVKKRAVQLARNLERLGVVNSIVSCAHPDAVAGTLGGYFDRVIVDAPCSGEGMFRKDETAIDEWSLEHIAACAVRQGAILDSAANCIIQGGKLVYSTCTFSEEENERTVEAFIKRHPEFELEFAHRLYPHRLKGEGHFVARLVKRGDPASPSIAPAKSSPCVKRCTKSEEALALGFLDSVFGFQAVEAVRGRLMTMNGRAYYLPFAAPDAALSLPIVSLGVEVGEFAGNRFKPSHSLFMAAHSFKSKFALELGLKSPELAAYLRGETVSCPDTAIQKGYCPVTVEGFPIGFAKIVDGVAKNHLPKGLTVNRIY